MLGTRGRQVESLLTLLLVTIQVLFQGETLETDGAFVLITLFVCQLVRHVVEPIGKGLATGLASVLSFLVGDVVSAHTLGTRECLVTLGTLHSLHRL